ncbi:protein DOG1-like 4 [Silene latifolia]|uniref:protein DOG1-like 4 n=1 Tax=Silene latifolia TaxID=37657 RepID=UPI003D77C1F8
MSFEEFQDKWTDQLRKIVDQLTATLARPKSADDNRQLRHLVDKVVTHYTDYYDEKTAVGRSDVLLLFAAPWASALERSLHWVAGFRPTTIFHLMYTESSIRFESHVADILRGRRTGDLGELNPAQLGRVSELQCQTVKEENEIGDALGGWQEAVARAEPEWAGGRPDAVERLLERLVEVVAKADELRMKTMRLVVEMLTPQQAAEFIVAMAELQFGIRAWGLHHDRERGAGKVCC